MAMMSDVSIPAEPSKEIAARARRLYHDEYLRLERLFATRPIWLRANLRKHLSNDLGPTEFKALIPAVAYFLMDGPWRSCWIRYGFDPRREPSARIYQVIEMRLVARLQSLVSNFPPALRRAAESAPERHVFDGTHLASNLSQYQYCDLTYPPLQALITNQRNFSETLDRREGWYIHGTVAQIRRMIKERWLELIRQADPDFFAQQLRSSSAMGSLSVADTTEFDTQQHSLVSNTLSDTDENEDDHDEQSEELHDTDEDDDIPEYEIYDG